MALKKVKGNLERIFDKNLTDLVRGIRNNKDNEVCIQSDLIMQLKLFMLRFFSNLKLTNKILFFAVQIYRSMH